MISAMIVDDEQHARDELSSLLNELGHVNIVASCANALEAVKLVNKHRPEVLFLDIQMPVIDGFELLSLLDRKVMPHIVFVTAYDQYALKAFEEKTLDYLLKPIDPERLKKTLEKITSAAKTGGEPEYPIAKLTRIPCASGNRIKLIDPQQVEYIHSDLSGVHVFTAGGNFFTELTLKILEMQPGLLRCHKQYLVNLAYVTEIIALEHGQAEIMTSNNHRLPVSRRYLRSLKDAFQL